MIHPENAEQYKGLKVTQGVADAPSVNPYLQRRPRQRPLNVSEFVEGILQGMITIVSKAVTLLECTRH